ncbi:MAG: SMI1/KNR4 family protein [Chloroflexota bacterium]|nr:SMI1/KNR4 family protein [Chloroflexota bacterium]
MDSSMEQLMSDLDLEDGVSLEVVERVQKELGFELPSDYANFVTLHNGGQGWVGSSYLMLWSVEKIAAVTEEAGFAEFCPGFYIFGSNGGGEAYAFDARSGDLSIVEVPYIGGPEDAIYCGRTFQEFFEFLYNRPSDGDTDTSDLCLH